MDTLRMDVLKIEASMDQVNCLSRRIRVYIITNMLLSRRLVSVCYENMSSNLLGHMNATSPANFNKNLKPLAQ